MRFGRLPNAGDSTRAPAEARRWPHPRMASAAPAQGRSARLRAAQDPSPDPPPAGRSTPRSTYAAAIAGDSAIARCRLARAPGRSPVSSSAMPRNACPPADPGSSRTLSRSSAIAFSLAPLYQRAAPRLCRASDDSGRRIVARCRCGSAAEQVALLAEDVSLQRVRLRMIGIQPEGFGERVRRRLEIATFGRRLRARRRPRLPGSMPAERAAARWRSAASMRRRARSSPRAAQDRCRARVRTPRSLPPSSPPCRSVCPSS